MFYKLSGEVVEIINEEVQSIKKEYGIVNPIIRNDIFRILEQLCVVLKYPLGDEEEANGLHVERWIKGRKVNFVFVNTNNTIEKLVYIAAHELGHVWKIDEKVLSKCVDNIDSEAIINRFAAELLMPAKLFLDIFENIYQEFGLAQGSNKGKHFLKMIFYFMDTFMVPYKAVIYRFEELELIGMLDRIKLEELEKDNSEFFREYSRMIGCQNIFKVDGQKAMGDLYQLLEKAEEQEILSSKRIKTIRKTFEYNSELIKEDDEIIINIISKE